MSQLLENLELDELGRVVIADPELLSLINGAQGSSDTLSTNLLNGACSNGSCH